MTRDTLIIKTPTATDDGIGSVITMTVQDTITGFITPATRNDLEVAGTLGINVTHTAMLPRGTTITPKHVIIDSSGTQFQVRRVVDARNVTIVNLEVIE